MTLEDLCGLCRRIRVAAPNAVIGGGAPRDIFLGGPVKDIDVFIQCDPARFVELGDAVARTLGAITAPYYAADMGYGAVRTYDFFAPGIVPKLSLIHRDCPPLMDVGDYDFGISQIACDDVQVYKTQAFLDDVRDNVVTYQHSDKDRPDWHRRSSAERLVRIRQKYPSLWPKSCDVLRPWLPEGYLT